MTFHFFLLRLGLLFFFLSSCQSRSPEYFQSQGKALLEQLLEEFEEIHDIDDLIEHLPRLRAVFDQLAKLIIEARKWQIKHNKMSWPVNEQNKKLNQDLRREVERLYAIPAARELIENSQQAALESLDAFEKRNQKK